MCLLLLISLEVTSPCLGISLGIYLPFLNIYSFVAQEILSMVEAVKKSSGP